MYIFKENKSISFIFASLLNWGQHLKVKNVLPMKQIPSFKCRSLEGFHYSRWQTGSQKVISLFLKMEKKKHFELTYFSCLYCVFHRSLDQSWENIDREFITGAVTVLNYPHAKSVNSVFVDITYRQTFIRLNKHTGWCESNCSLLEMCSSYFFQ